MAVWINFFSAAPTAQNSPELNIRFIDSCIQWSVVLYLGMHSIHSFDCTACTQIFLRWCYDADAQLNWVATIPEYEGINSLGHSENSKMRINITMVKTIFPNMLSRFINAPGWLMNANISLLDVSSLWVSRKPWHPSLLE